MVWELNRRGHKNIIAVDTVAPNDRPEILAHLNYSEFISDQEIFDFLASSDHAKVSAIFHMGACSSTTEKDVEFLRRNNTEYTQRLWEIALSKSWPFLYASSGAVYGDGRNGFDDGQSTRLYRPLNPYGWSKAHFDVWAEEQRKTPRRWYGFRFFNVFGPNEYHKGEMSSVVFKAWKQIQDSGRLRLFRSHNSKYRDGEQMRDFVYVKDVTRWMWEIYEQPTVASGIYNMGFGKARTWLDLAKAVFENLKRPVNIEWIDIPEEIRSQYQYFTEAKMDRLFHQNVSPPEWSLEAGVTDYLQNYLLQPNRYLKDR